MRRSRVAVEVETSGRLEHAVELDQADGHHGEIGHHVVLAEEAAHGPEQLGRAGPAGAHHLVEGVLRLVVPVPRILERLDLRVGAVPGLRLEQNVVVGVRVERRVEVDEIDALVRDAVVQDLQIVAVVKLVHEHPRLQAP